MQNVPSVRLTAPKPSSGAITRQTLVNTVLNSDKKLAYIHAGAGYGKTTLLSQIASASEKTVWLSLDGENDVFTFVDTLSESVHRQFPEYAFMLSEYLPFENRENFIPMLADAWISSVENLATSLLIVLDDLHTINDAQTKQLILCIIKYKPEYMGLCLSSREAPWQDLIPWRVRGHILELTQEKLAFTKDEVNQVLGFESDEIYNITEGWPLAIGSFKLPIDSGVSLMDIPDKGSEVLHAYLFYECIQQLPSEMVNFLHATACFEELDAPMLDTILGIKNARLILDNLVFRNLFTIKTGNKHYRYHALFREYLLKGLEDSKKQVLYNQAAIYFCNQTAYSKAAEYAILAGDTLLLQQIILTSYKGDIKKGNFGKLRRLFQALNDNRTVLLKEVLVAKGAFLSSIGKFNDAKLCLDAAIPLLKEDEDVELFIEAMLHKARVLRNFESFEASNQLLDELLAKGSQQSLDIRYSIAIEKLYNFCWNSQIRDAYALINEMIESCARAGNLKIKAWFERYLTVVHFFAGRMKDTVYYYEKSLLLPEDEQSYLDLHSIGMYAAKAYQMLGNRSQSLAILSAELQKLRTTGRYEELWSAYLFAAEITYQNTFIDQMNGNSHSYQTTVKYFTLADEYAPLYRSTEFQMQWAKMQRLVYSLMFTSDPKDEVISAIFSNLNQVGDYFKTIVLARLFGYFGAITDFPNAVKCAMQCIEIGERSDIMLLPTLAYGILARAAITMQDEAQAIRLTKRYLQLCDENGIYEYFKVRQAYDPLLEFAFDHGIEPDFTEQMMLFAGYKPKKVYINTLGGFSVFPYSNRQEPLKMRTKKERELFALLLDAGSEGLTKEQIYQAIWSESESDNVKKLIGVNLAQIKKDLSSLGIENVIIKHEKHYSICKDEIEVDYDQFQAAKKEFELHHSHKALLQILALYKGEYLSDFEAFWAVAKRIKCRETYEKALQASEESSY